MVYNYCVHAALVVVLVLAGGTRVMAFEDGVPKEAKPIAELQQKYGEKIMAIPGVNGHGIGKKGEKYALVIFAVDEAGKKNAEAFLEKLNKDKSKDTLEGHPVLINVVGEIRPR